MKKILIIFSVLSLLIFIRPALGLNSVQTTTESTTIVQTEEATSDRFIDEALGGIKQFYFYTGFANATTGNLIMILIGIIFIYLGIKFDYEPLLLIPIGAGVIIGNIPFVAGNQTGIYETGSVLNYLYFGVVKGIYPPLIFLGIGAMTDFSSLIANPKLMLLGAAAQIGVFATF
jgi:oxaloacetate decarboxylase beta subunit